MRWEILLMWAAARGMMGAVLAVAAIWLCRWEDQVREAFLRERRGKEGSGVNDRFGQRRRGRRG